MFCGNCGKQIDDQASFCPYCGAAVRRVEQAASEQQAAPEQQVMPEAESAAEPVTQDTVDQIVQEPVTPDPAMQQNIPNPAMQQGNPDPNMQYGNPNPNMQYGNPNPNMQYGSPNPNMQYNNPNMGYGQQPQPKKSISDEEIIKNFVARLKSFFSKDVLEGVKQAAKSTTHEWTIFTIAYVLFFAISVPIALHRTMGSFSYIGSYLKQVMPFFRTLLASFAAAIVSGAVITGGMYLKVKVLMKKDVSVLSVLNAVLYASLPVVVACAANIILGLIWVPLTVMVFLTAVLMQVRLLWVAEEELAGGEHASFYLSSLVTLGCIFVILLIAGVLYKGCLSAALNGLFGSYY